MNITNHTRRDRRKKRVRAIIKGTSQKPRISVFRSNKYSYAQAIDDEKRITLASASRDHIKKELKDKVRKVEEARIIGKKLAEKLLKKNVKQGVLDRSLYAYKGRVRAFTEGLRDGGFKI